MGGKTKAANAGEPGYVSDDGQRQDGECPSPGEAGEGEHSRSHDHGIPDRRAHETGQQSQGSKHKVPSLRARTPVE